MPSKPSAVELSPEESLRLKARQVQRLLEANKERDTPFKYIHHVKPDQIRLANLLEPEYNERKIKDEEDYPTAWAVTANSLSTTMRSFRTAAQKLIEGLELDVGDTEDEAAKGTETVVVPEIVTDTVVESEQVFSRASRVSAPMGDTKEGETHLDPIREEPNSPDPLPGRSAWVSFPFKGDTDSTQVRHLKIRLQDKAAEISELQKKVKSQDLALSEGKTQLQRLEAKLKAQDAELSSLWNESQAPDRRVAELRHQVKDLQHNNRDLKSESRKQMTGKIELQEQLDDVTRKWREAEVEVERKNDELCCAMDRLAVVEKMKGKGKRKGDGVFTEGNIERLRALMKDGRK